MKEPTKYSQLTLDRVPSSTKPNVPQIGNVPEKRIAITQIDVSTGIDELSLKIGFRLFPSNEAFSKVHATLWFDNQKIHSLSIRIPQGPLAVDEYEFTPMLGMKGIPAGSHRIKVEMYELWSTSERLLQVEKELTVDYVPQTRESKFVAVPIVKSVVGEGLSVISKSEKELYGEIEKTAKKEYIANRDGW
jgi:hypothetical protein